MGYQTNQVASSLKKKPLKIVVAFPAPVSDNRFFFGELWKGYRDFKKEMQFYNCQVIEARMIMTGSTALQSTSGVFSGNVKESWMG